MIQDERFFRISSVCAELIERTTENEQEWISVAALKEYLINEGLGVGRISWFKNYLLHLQKVRIIPNAAQSFITVFKGRVHVLSKSKYSGLLRLEFFSQYGYRYQEIWKSVVAPQEILATLHSTIMPDDTEENCRELLYFTSSIHT